MKKIVTTSLMVFIGIAAYAQPATSQSSGTVTLNVKLHPIQTLTVNPNSKIVDLEYKTEAQYSNGVKSAVLADHLTVYSTGGFAVSVKSSGTHLITNANANPTHGQIEASSVKVSAFEGSKPITSVKNGEHVPLSSTETTIVSSDYGAVNKTINVQYEGAGADTYINNYIATQKPTVYTTELTYTIIAQ